MKTQILLGLIFVVLTGCKKEESYSFVYPTTMSISKITVSRYALEKEDGTDWDLNDEPDLYILLDKEWHSDFSLALISEVHSDSTLSYKYAFDVDWTIDSLTQSYVIGLFDEDEPDEDDYLGGFRFRPTDHYRGKKEINISDPNLALNFQLLVEWNF
ncbi:MAG: hypothetical protein AB8B69_25005 [Chitinophagales bacterium]